MNQVSNVENADVVALTPSHLMSGMVLAKPLYTSTGMLMLNKDSELTERLITRLQQFEQSEDSTMLIYVHETL